MNQMKCPTCGSVQKIVGQSDRGAMTKGALLVLDCGHAFELIAPRAEPDRNA